MSAVYESPQLLNQTLHRPVEILLVEDSPSDAKLTVIALREARVANNLRVVVDGVAAMAYLRNEGEYSDAARPDLILLDLNLPRKDGREVLAEIKADEGLRGIPVIVLTTSAAESDVLRAYTLQANGYVTKPIRFADFLDVVHGIEEFWLSLVRLPRVRGKPGGAAAGRLDGCPPQP
jgi:chemotaxis family two-component system response regulator Rcp1